MKRFQDKTTGVISSSDLKTVKGKVVYTLINVILIFMCVVSLAPFIWTIFAGLKETQEMYTSNSFFPKNLTFAVVKERVGDAVKVMNMGRAFLNTLFISVASTLFSLVVGGLGGFVLSRLKPRGSGLIFTLVVWTMMMPSQIRTVPLFMSYLSFPFLAELPGEVNLLNTYWPMILGAVANAFNVMLFKNNFDSISKSYIEAARIDGCSDIRMFFNIMIPLSLPIIIYVGIGVLQAPWGDFFTPYLVLTDDALQTLPVKVFNLKSDPTVSSNTYMMCLVLSSLPGFAIFALFQKYMVGGVNVGGVKE